jgi:FlaG/FlaF family flagellin (archaellin)
VRLGQVALVIKASVLIAFLLAGLRYVFIGNDLSSSSLAPDPTVTFLKTLYNNNSYMGVVSATLTVDQSFVVGANISAEVKIGLPNAANTTYLIEIMFPDAISVRTIPPYTWQQDWNYLLSDIQIVESEQIQTISNVTLVYAHEGLYGLNVTIHQLDQHFYFYDLVQIKPVSYLQEKLRSNLSFAMNFEILGLTIIMVAPIAVQLAGFIEQAFQGKTPENSQEKEPSQQEKIGHGKGSSGTNDQKPRKNRADKTTDLLKVQIYADRSHMKLTSLFSFIFAYSVGLTVLFYTVLYQGLGPDPGTTWLVGFMATWISTVAFLGYVLWDYNKDVKAISRMIEAVKERKTLPELEKLSRKSIPE